MKATAMHALNKIAHTTPMFLNPRASRQPGTRTRSTIRLGLRIIAGASVKRIELPAAMPTRSGHRLLAHKPVKADKLLQICLTAIHNHCGPSVFARSTVDGHARGSEIKRIVAVTMAKSLRLRGGYDLSCTSICK